MQAKTIRQIIKQALNVTDAGCLLRLTRLLLLMREDGYIDNGSIETVGLLSLVCVCDCTSCTLLCVLLEFTQKVKVISYCLLSYSLINNTAVYYTILCLLRKTFLFKIKR